MRFSSLDIKNKNRFSKDSPVKLQGQVSLVGDEGSIYLNLDEQDIKEILHCIHEKLETTAKKSANKLGESLVGYFKDEDGDQVSVIESPDKKEEL